MPRYERSSTINVESGEVYAWHLRAGALERLTPPWQSVQVLGESEGIRLGSQVELRLGRRPLSTRWIAEHTRVDPGSGFEDVQREGPFRSWRHQHLFEPSGEGRCLLHDRIDYRLPGGHAGEWVAGSVVRKELERTFRYRHSTTVGDIEFHHRYADRPPLKVAISGSSGLIGDTLASLLTTGGHRVIRLVRPRNRPMEPNEALWDPVRGILEPQKMEDLNAIIHLAGESVSRGRWTEAKKKRIQDSRVLGTRSLVRSLGELRRPPEIFVSASAVGYYGDREDEIVDESSDRGQGFLSEVAVRWEEEGLKASAWADQVALARLGVVLTPKGGALAAMLPTFRVGGGGRIGSGRQYMSWISIDDAASSLIHILMNPDLRGPINITAPHPVPNSVFAKTLGQALRRPTFIPMPEPLIRLLFGEMGEAILLTGNRVLPNRLLESGYQFRHQNLSQALAHLLGCA